MKKLTSLILAISILITACDNNKSKETDIVSNDSTNKTSPDSKEKQNESVSIEENKVELSNMTPLSIEELKTLIPASLLSVASTNVNANNSMGAGLATADFNLSDSTSIILNIYDCAGSAGAGIYSMQYLGLLTMQKDNHDEYRKTVEFNDSKAIEYCKRSTNDCNFTYLAGGRYLVTLEGDNVGIDVLKQAARALNLK